MNSKRWREHLTYIVMSAFVAWHTLAIVIAPAPDTSVMVQSLRILFQPYLSLLRLDNLWDFFAPTVPPMSDFRYVIEDAAGNQHTFVPTANLAWFHPSSIWFRSWYNGIMESPEIYADAAAARLCRKHVSLHPISITLLEFQGGDFKPKDQLNGKRPMDAEFVTVNTLKRVKCPDN